MKLFLLRHIKSVWNEENRFTGWMDIPLDKNYTEDAQKLAEKIFQHKVDAIYSSSLFRNQDTIARVLQSKDKYPIFLHLDGGKMKQFGNYTDISDKDIPVFITYRLNERYYGNLQGENKEGIIKKYGEEKVHLWRRSYNVRPPKGESLLDVEKRVIPFFNNYVKRDLKENKNVLIVASHNALRAIIKIVEKISPDDIIKVEVDYGGLIQYEMGQDFNILNKQIL